jgi:dihydrofolate reductase
MRKIIYYVAASLDGFICGPDADISGFVAGGSGVERYLADLRAFDTVLMGRRTYEFGYRFGLPPGQAPYPHMENYVFSSTLELENRAANLHVAPPSVELIEELKAAAGADIYLCGGGELAGWLLGHALIDVLKLKLNPFILGQGVPLFGRSQRTVQAERLDRESHEHGLESITYALRYGA